MNKWIEIFIYLTDELVTNGHGRIWLHENSFGDKKNSLSQQAVNPYVQKPVAYSF
jgi:hypothetical protein